MGETWRSGVEFKDQCRKCFHFQVCASVLKTDLYIREVLLGEKEPKCEAFVEVVRCRDCRYPENHCRCFAPHGAALCNDQEYLLVDGDDFCSYGERREPDEGL